MTSSAVTEPEPSALVVCCATRASVCAGVVSSFTGTGRLSLLPFCTSVSAPELLKVYSFPVPASDRVLVISVTVCPLAVVKSKAAWPVVGLNSMLSDAPTTADDDTPTSKAPLLEVSDCKALASRLILSLPALSVSVPLAVTIKVLEPVPVSGEVKVTSPCASATAWVLASVSETVAPLSEESMVSVPVVVTVSLVLSAMVSPLPVALMSLPLPASVTLEPLPLTSTVFDEPAEIATLSLLVALTMLLEPATTAVAALDKSTVPADILTVSATDELPCPLLSMDTVSPVVALMVSPEQ